jgi:acetoin utilization deacetylase AcuC-like enzyme
MMARRPYEGKNLFLWRLVLPHQPKDKALNQVDMEKVEVVGISAGFDAHQGDLASLGSSVRCYREIGRKVGALGKSTFGVLKGGYIGENISRDLHELIQGIEGK